LVCCKQALILSLPHYIDKTPLFKNTPATKERPFLIIKEDMSNGEILLVNITSEKFDRAKPFFRPGHYPISKHHPPF
jgi:hypothetical protein